jgi:hypothetical protein
MLMDKIERKKKQSDKGFKTNKEQSRLQLK